MIAASQAPQTLHVLVRREGEAYVAQCVEYDVAAEGETVDDAKRAFGETLLRHVLAARQFDQPLFANVGPPPDDVKAAWDQTLQAGATPEPLPIPRFKIRRRSAEGEGWAAEPPAAEMVCA